ncbi:MAG: ComF family protein [Schlesneria sp.]|nr:ComF family protein [Schlesneria sp.]
MQYCRRRNRLLGLNHGQLMLKTQTSSFPTLLRSLGRAAVEFIYPPTCLLCPTGISEEADQHPDFCSGCLNKLTTVIANACLRCGAPVGPFTIASDHCILCKREGFAFDEVIRLNLYRDETRVACLRAKNPSGALLAKTLVNLLVDAQQIRLSQQTFDAIVPVPEHWLKRLVRSQYAAETMARQIATRLKVRLATDILAKARWTPKQAKSSPVQRRQQQQDAFRAVKSSLQGQSILLVDDILTTGATADAAAKALKRAGAKRVVVAVVAVSPPRV